MIDWGLRLLLVFALVFVVLSCAVGLMVLYAILGTVKDMRDKDETKSNSARAQKDFYKSWALILGLSIFGAVLAVFFT